MAHPHQITDIPNEEKADEIIAQFIELDGCSSAEKVQQDNGLWTVNAICSTPPD